MKARAIVVTLSIVFASASANAQPVDDASRAAARQLGYEGVNAYTSGDYSTASERLERAYAILKVPTVGLWSARSLARLGKLVAASERYQEALRLPLPDVETEVHKKAQADAQEERAALLPRLSHVVIAVATTTPSPFVVTLDGTNVPAPILGTDLPVDPGTRHVELRSGERATARDVTLTEGESQRVELTLAEEPAPVAPPVVEPVRTVETPKRVSGTMRTAGWITLGVGTAGVLFGAIMGGVAASEDSRLDGVCKDKICPTSETDAVDTYQRNRTLSILGFWIGGAAVATGVVLVLVAPHPNQASVSMTIGPGTFGVSGRY